MSAKSKGTTSPAEGPVDGPASKTKVKEQIKIIVDDLELVLGDLKDVAKELKEVVDQIDTLTSDLQLEDEMTDSSKTDTLNSSSSSTTASSLDKIKVCANTPLISPPTHPSTVLTVLRKPNPPPPPPRLTPVKFEDTLKVEPSSNKGRNNGILLRNGGFPGGPVNIPNGDRCAIHNFKVEKNPDTLMTHRTEKERCAQSSTRERVRFSENVLYHGYCPDCDVQSDIKNRDLHLHGELVHIAGKRPHHCSTSPTSSHAPFPIENGGLGINSSSSHHFQKTGTQPPQAAPKPQKTILRKSTTTTV